MKHIKKRILSSVFAFLLAVSCGAMALAAEDGTAFTMKLARIEGTVDISTGSSRKVSVRKDMRLYNGYEMNTLDRSYAWVSLDNRRMVKLDAASEASVRKRGKKLEILLDSGNIFFNVAKPLEDDESFFIRTSTTAIGIRGTCGWVEVTDERTVNVVLLEGTVQVTVWDPVTGQDRTVTVSGGERVSCVVCEPGKTGDQCGILREQCTKQDVPGFVLTELVPDSPLVEKICTESGIDLRDVTSDDATRRLREDEEQIAGKLAQVEEAMRQQPSGGASVWAAPESAPSRPQVEQSTRQGLEQPLQPGVAQPTQPGGRQRNPLFTLLENFGLGGGNQSPPGGGRPVWPGNEQPGGEQPSQSGGKQPAQAVTHTVIFDGNGGSLAGRSTVTVTVEKGKMVADPGAPTRSGYVFRGWFTDRTYAREWDFGRDTVVQDTRLYAGWEESPPVTYTVTFDGKGGSLAGGDTITVTVREGQLVAEPSDPLLAGNIFSGWFVQGSAAEWNFNTPVDRDITLTAGWEPPTLEAIQRRLNRNRSVTLDETFPDEAFTIAGNLTVPGGTVLTFRKPVQVAPAGNVTVNGTMNAEQGLTNQGTITVNSANTLNVAGTLNTEGSGKLAITQKGKVMADTLTGPVNLELGAQVFCKNQTGRPDGNQITLSTDFKISKKGWNLLGNGYYRLDHFAWKKLESKDLTIGGVGDMPNNYPNPGTPEGMSSTPPWGKDIKTVVIQDGVTSISSSAFSDCFSLTSVTIPDSVTSIGDSAFSYCSSLTGKLNIPAGVTSIGNYAFRECSGLTGNLTIPESVTSIGDSAFYGCSSLTGNLNIPNKVTSIGNYAFRECSGLTGNLNIPAGVTSIGDSAFSGCSGLTGNLNIPNKVTSIGNFAFEGCSGLTGNFNIPASVTSMGMCVFSGCSGLTGSFNIPKGTTSIADCEFMNCRGLTSITIPDSVTNIGSSAFYGCSSLTSVNIPNGVTSIGDSAFSGCSSLTNVTIPDRVTSISSSAFEACSGLTGITIPNSVTSIGAAAFSGCRSLTGVTIPDRVTSISSSAFEACSGLTGITIPNSVTSIGAAAFSGCSSLTSVTIPAGVTSIEQDTFKGCSGLTSINIPEGVTSISEFAFRECSGLTSVTIPGSVTEIKNAAFWECSSLTSITIPDSVTNMVGNAFYGCSSLNSVIIGKGVTSIGNFAFKGCSSLTSITIPDSMTSIDDSAFEGCRSLTSVIIGKGVTSIEYSAFKGCSGLTSVTIPDSVISIEKQAFYGCSSLTSVTYTGTKEQWKTIAIGADNKSLTDNMKWDNTETKQEPLSVLWLSAVCSPSLLAYYQSFSVSSLY